MRYIFSFISHNHFKCGVNDVQFRIFSLFLISARLEGFFLLPTLFFIVCSRVESCGGFKTNSICTTMQKCDQSKRCTIELQGEVLYGSDWEKGRKETEITIISMRMWVDSKIAIITTVRLTARCPAMYRIIKCNVYKYRYALTVGDHLLCN